MLVGDGPFPLCSGCIGDGDMVGAACAGLSGFPQAGHPLQLGWMGDWQLEHTESIVCEAGGDNDLDGDGIVMRAPHGHLPIIPAISGLAWCDFPQVPHWKLIMISSSVFDKGFGLLLNCSAGGTGFPAAFPLGAMGGEH